MSVLSKLMRIAGRGDDGTAKAIATTNKGYLHTYLSGSDMQNKPLYVVGELEKCTVPTSDGTGQSVHPSVVYLPKGFGGYKYWMAMTPYPNENNTTEFPEIVASNDGKTWVVPAGITNPIDTDDTFMPDTSLIYDRAINSLVVYYSSGDGGGTTYRRTLNVNLVLSARVATNVVLSGGCVVKVSDGDWVAFNINNTLYDYPQLVRRISKDGINWSDKYDVGSNLRGSYSHVMAYYDGAGFHFLLSTSPRDSQNLQNMQLHYGYSEYGDYVIFDSAPIVLPDAGKWYSRAIYTSCLALGENQTLNMYVSTIGIDKTVYINVVPVKFGSLVDLAWKSSQRRQLILYDKLEIRDTTTYYYGGTSQKSILGFNDYPHKTIIIRNSHTSPIDLVVLTRIRGVAVDSLYFGNERTQQKITISAGAITVLTSKDLPCLEGEFAGAVTINLAAPIAPSAGELTAVLAMWR